jgi:hypothetical protein
MLLISFQEWLWRVAALRLRSSPRIALGPTPWTLQLYIQWYVEWGVFLKNYIYNFAQLCSSNLMLP